MNSPPSFLDESVQLRGGGTCLFVNGGVPLAYMEGQIQTQKYGFTENFEPKDNRILHIYYPKIWVTILI